MNTRHALLSIACLASLTACGGGDDAPLPPANMQTRAGVMAHCRLTERSPAERDALKPGDGGFSYAPYAFIGSAGDQGSSIMAWGNTTDADPGLVPLTTRVGDTRGRSELAYAQAAGEQNSYMGMTFSSHLADGSLFAGAAGVLRPDGMPNGVTYGAGVV